MRVSAGLLRQLSLLPLFGFRRWNDCGTYLVAAAGAIAGLFSLKRRECFAALGPYSERSSRGWRRQAGVVCAVLASEHRDVVFRIQLLPFEFDKTISRLRFLMMKESNAGDRSHPASMVVVLNWFEELKRRVPTQ